jgi:hypothetical protein
MRNYQVLILWQNKNVTIKKNSTNFQGLNLFFSKKMYKKQANVER